MKDFIYKARTPSGKLIKGAMKAENNDEVIRQLREKDYLPILIKEYRKLFIPAFFKRGVAPAEINLFSRQLCALLKAGIPLIASLSAIRDQTEKRVFKEILEEIIEDIEKGSFFSEALSRHEATFGKVYVSMIKSAETGGSLAEVLKRLILLGEREEEIRLKIRSAAAYPIIVVGALTAAFFVVVTFIIPKFAKIFSSFNASLPLPTRILVGLNRLFASFWPLLLVGGVFLIIAFIFFINTSRGRSLWDRVKIKIPIAGPLILKIILSRFSRVSAILTATGVPIITILELAEESAANCIIAKEIRDISSQVVKGESLASAMSGSEFFPPLVIKMVSAGEGSGKLDELLSFVSEYYDSQVEYTLKNLTTYLEPLLIVILACFVLFFALAVFLPMWDLFHVVIKH